MRHTDPGIALSFATCEKLGITFVEQTTRLVSSINEHHCKMVLTYACSFIIEKGLHYQDLGGCNS